GVLSTHLYADGRHAEKLWVDAPGLAHDPFISAELIEEGQHRAVMEGREVFKFASVLMPQSVATALKANGVTPADVKLLVPHQANLRILEMVQKTIGLRDDQVYVNIQKYGNTTAASIPIALHEALCEGRLKRGDLLILTAFGSGFTWARPGGATVSWRIRRSSFRNSMSELSVLAVTTDASATNAPLSRRGANCEKAP